ncbi:PadR family transcriptional regulator [Alkalihalophilus pseudofirmus]|uniref:PadR family transcriptional regulator n=1 Tax=Alkalihalophilus pseudofirmus TaxID=79885 RepID=A0AAJ2KU04_ALKPS|nr:MULTISPECIES: PadR family transcriptional regulator [Alkalihalophilus]MDV2884649.1 PadR family transcriptional regulator [Alkalihalophilus pseudofirmus]MED1603169.1 PadR family transcriptional regulator [Alkalihalophilus marmarensis]
MSLRYALLGIISKKPVTGYDVVRIFKQQMVYFWSSTHSQIYTELHKMEKEDLIEHELVIQGTSPNKKVYHLTDSGKKDLIRWAMEEPLKPAKIKDEFLIKATIFPVLTVIEINKLLDEVIEREERILSMTKQWKEHFDTQAERDAGTMLTVEYGIRYSEMYLEWCKWAKQYIHENKG